MVSIKSKLDDCGFRESCFRNVKLVNCDLEGMAIDGVLVSEAIKAFKESKL